MNNDKAFMRHEILNMINVVNFLIMDAEMGEKEKADALKRLKLVSLLTSKGEVFLGKKKKVVKRTIQLDDVLETVQLIFEQRKPRLKLLIELTHYSFKGSAEVIRNGVEEIVNWLSASVKKIEISRSGKKLKLTHNSKKAMKLKKMSLMDALHAQVPAEEIFLRSALEMMMQSGMKITYGKSAVTITLP